MKTRGYLYPEADAENPDMMSTLTRRNGRSGMSYVSAGACAVADPLWRGQTWYLLKCSVILDAIRAKKYLSLANLMALSAPAWDAVGASWSSLRIVGTRSSGMTSCLYVCLCFVPRRPCGDDRRKRSSSRYRSLVGTWGRLGSGADGSASSMSINLT